MTIKLKRIYDNYSVDDGYRILVDRLWARGISKERAQVDLWMKEIAPSTELRKWFWHDPVRWNDFVVRYHAELDNNPEFVTQLCDLIAEHETITLVYSAKDEVYNQAVALRHYLNTLLNS